MVWGEMNGERLFNSGEGLAKGRGRERESRRRENMCIREQGRTCIVSGHLNTHWLCSLPGNAFKAVNV